MSCSNKVVTYMSSNQESIDVCPRCAKRIDGTGKWPKDQRGEEFATVTHGLHEGQCEAAGIARGPGRPPIDPGYETVSLPTVRISQAQNAELQRLMKAKGMTIADVIRGFLDASKAEGS